MSDTNISAAETGNLSSIGTNYSVDPISTDGPNGESESYWTNLEYTQQLGYYKTIPELQAAIDAKATWTIGKGAIAEPETQFILDKINGFGKDTFNSILENAIRTYHIGGDAYIEIIRDNKKNLINLKPLDPSTIKIVASPKGIIKNYIQTSKVKKTEKPFKKNQIFHLSRKRIADEIHGISLIKSVERIILMRNEAMEDYKKLLHRNIYPIRIWHLDSDVPSKVAAFKAKVLAAKEDFEDIFIPKGAVETEIAATPPNSMMNPLPWINQLNQYFFQAASTPQIVVGGAMEITEASAKIAYLAFEQTIEEEQLYIEEQVGIQLGIEIELEFPASLQNELLSDQTKSESMQAATPEDTTAKPQPVTGVAK